MNELLSWYQDTPQHAMFQAVPGAGKTFEIASLSQAMTRRDGAVAFSRDIARELRGRVSPQVPVTTVHALGLRMLSERAGGPGSLQVEPDKFVTLARSLVRDDEQASALGRAAELSLLSLGRRPEDELFEGLEGEAREQVRSALPRLLESAWLSFRDSGRLTFAEMVAYPARLGSVKKFATLCVDEAQDLSRAALSLLLTVAERVLFCGDPFQSIYGFAGAEVSSMALIRAGCGAHFERNVTRRCPVGVVDLARRFNPKLTASEHAPDGEVFYDSLKSTLGALRSGALVLARHTEPLLSAALWLHRMGRPVTLRGSSLSELARLAPEIDGLFTQPEAAIERYYRQKTGGARVLRLEKSLLRLAGLLEGGLSSQRELEHFCRALEAGQPGAIVLMTMHRAKGLEAHEVALLDLQPDLPQGSAGVQERNLRYVALTRVKAGGERGGTLRFAASRPEVEAWLSA